VFDGQLDVPLACSTCGGPLGLSYDDQPDWPGGPQCGACYQANQEDDEIMIYEELGDG